ncbi:MAG: hypothetical protein LBD93_00605 [Treponema sp.]|jgi:hypothetical protein|nr:hypothetical protein [Treponema sp.]
MEELGISPDDFDSGFSGIVAKLPKYTVSAGNITLLFDQCAERPDTGGGRGGLRKIGLYYYDGAE